MSLVFVVQSSLCKQDFKLTEDCFLLNWDRVSFLASLKHLSQLYWKLSSLAKTYGMEQDPAGILRRLSEKLFACHEWLFVWFIGVAIWAHHFPQLGFMFLHPEMLKQRNNIFFLGCSTVWLKCIGLNFSPSLVLTYLLCHPCTKKWV